MGQECAEAYISVSLAENLLTSFLNLVLLSLVLPSSTQLMATLSDLSVYNRALICHFLALKPSTALYFLKHIVFVIKLHQK